MTISYRGMLGKAQKSINQMLLNIILILTHKVFSYCQFLIQQTRNSTIFILHIIIFHTHIKYRFSWLRFPVEFFEYSILLQFIRWSLKHEYFLLLLVRIRESYYVATHNIKNMLHTFVI